MRFEAPLIRGTLVRRYKRFLADVVLDDGTETTVHCPNTGSMMGCCMPGSAVWLLRASNPARKYPLGWELVEVDPAVLVGINTGRSNALVAEALDRGMIPELAAYESVRREVAGAGHPVEGSTFSLKAIQGTPTVTLKSRTSPRRSAAASRSSRMR